MADLTDYGLEPGDTVRFRPPLRPTGNWHEGNVRSINKDGSVEIGTPTGIRAIMPDRLEVKRTGPRGGRQWQPVPATRSDRG